MGNSCQDQQEQDGQSPEHGSVSHTGSQEKHPVHDMEKTANVEPLERRRSLKILIQG